MSDSSFIHVHGLTHHYPRMREPALRDIELQIPKGCSFGLLGPMAQAKQLYCRYSLVCCHHNQAQSALPVIRSSNNRQ